MKHYERRLPHWDHVGEAMFVTFRLYGSLPSQRVFPPERVTAGRAFVAMDRVLDRATNGFLFLRMPEIAEVVEKALLDEEERFRRYELHAYVVMANHVHVLVTPRVAPTKWLGPLKGYTAHEANRLLGRIGKHFWQDESYDHVVRSTAEFERIAAYIENNPVTAGIVASAEEFRWSSASRLKSGCSQDWLPHGL